MKSRFVKWFGVAYGALLATAGVVVPAPAANINTNATECQAQFWPQEADIVHTEKGISTGSTVTASRWISCAIPRSPLASTATSGSFYIDGDSQNGQWMVCSLASYDFTGTFLGSSSFSSPGPAFDILLSLPAAQLGYWAYTGIICVLPPNGNGTLRGVTSLQ